MFAKANSLKFAAFGAVLFMSSFIYQRSATAADARLPSLVQNYATSTLLFRKDPLRNSMQSVYAMTWMMQIQQLLNSYDEAAVQDSRYCVTALDNYEYLFRKLERFNLDDDPLAVPSAAYIVLQNACSQ